MVGEDRKSRLKVGDRRESLGKVEMKDGDGEGKAR